MIHKIISGGQTGADRGGLIAGKILGIETGGTAPKGWMTEDGPYPALGHFYGLKEGPPGYPARTRLNVADSDATLLMGNPGSLGSALTCAICTDLNKPCLVNPTPAALMEWLDAHDVGILNVAGNRASKNPTIEGVTYHLLRDTILGIREAQLAREICKGSLRDTARGSRDES